jgi:hypothetical protein
MNCTRSEIEQIIKLFNEWQSGPHFYITNINEAVEYIIKNLKEE